MSSAMISQTLQGAVLSMTSNVLAQAISSYKDSVGDEYRSSMFGNFLMRSVDAVFP
jgi:hypothetical protein